MKLDEILLYSDESCYIQNDGNNCMALATIYLNSMYKIEILTSFKEILKKYNIVGEIKWGKICPGNVHIYNEILIVLKNYVDNKKIRVRTLLAICDKQSIEKNYSEWYDSMYYYLFRKIVDDKIVTTNLHLLIDRKDTHSSNTVKKIGRYLENYSLWEKKILATAENSLDHILIQIADIIAGATTYKYRNLKTSNAKLEIISHIEKLFNTNLIASSLLSKLDFNTFVWRDKR